MGVYGGPYANGNKFIAKMCLEGKHKKETGGVEEREEEDVGDGVWL